MLVWQSNMQSRNELKVNAWTYLWMYIFMLQLIVFFFFFSSEIPLHIHIQIRCAFSMEMQYIFIHYSLLVSGLKGIWPSLMSDDVSVPYVYVYCTTHGMA